MYLTTSTYTPCSLPSTTTTTTTTSKNLTTPVRSRTNSFLLRRPLLLVSTSTTTTTTTAQITNTLQQQPQQHFKLHNSSDRNSTNMMQSYVFSREQQKQQRQQQSSKSIASFKLDQLPADRASDFAAQMACYFWFCDNTDPSPNTPGGNGQRRISDIRPRESFKKFCREVISATQVSHSVILLSLLYIYRMKTNNPAIQGHPGSEFRTFTVALMLANKFLDDNTYTNKTWSEVTNISVREINIMEIEFLSSLDFSLYVSEQQYYDWVRSISQLLANDHEDNHYRDPRPPADCSIPLPKKSPLQYASTVPQESYNVPIPMDTTISPRSFKRSAEQAFVDTGMVTSPPKRTALYPIYTQSAVSSQSRQVPTFQNLSQPTTTNSSAPIFYQLSSFNLQPQPSTNCELATTEFIIQNFQNQYVLEQMQLLYARRSNYLNSRSAAIGFHPMTNAAFQTTVM